MRSHVLLAASLLLSLANAVHAGDGNRLTYLDGSDAYYPHRTFPKLTTPMWVGEDGVEAVVILSIDDMRGHEKWEAFLRPILRRLKEIDGRAPVSIMTNQIDPKEAHLQTWLKEGLSLETHTYDHPCPFLQAGDFDKAKGTYDRCVDQMAEIPGSRPIAFRMPCCDSLNTASPRFFREIFAKSTSKGNFLAVDSSIFTVINSDDPELPRELVLDNDGQDRFRKYLPVDRSFVNTIDNYPYPYVIGGFCWEFPCLVPSDWEANHLFKAKGDPRLTADWKAALDAVVLKKGVMPVVFHPHGWSKPEQFIELIDHAVKKHGKKVKFLTFREAHDRLVTNVLGGQTLRQPRTGQDNGIRLLDVNNDGYIDVVIGNDQAKQTRIWSPGKKAWEVIDFPTALVKADDSGALRSTGVRFGVLRPDGAASMIVSDGKKGTGWHFQGGKWVEDSFLGDLPAVNGFGTIRPGTKGQDGGIRLRDLDNDGRCELIVANDKQQAVFSYNTLGQGPTWAKLPFSLPENAMFVDGAGKDMGLRFVDIDEDGYADIIFSNEQHFGLHLFTSLEKGWSRSVLSGKAGAAGALPMITRKGTDNGAWFHSRSLWVQNENTALLKDHMERRSFNEMLASVEPTARSAEASLKALRARSGFVVEQVVAEPLVQDPIAFAWGPDGKLWVVEMGDYPLGIDGKGKPGGKVLCIESTKGDGKYDKATVFLDKLPFPTNVLPWRKGVLITCAPDILYAEDTDGDGKADRVEKLFTGFTEGNQQHRVNSLVWGLDNWIYCANGDSGGTVRSAKKGMSVNISGRDLRIRPDTGDIDLQTGQTQYGRCRDDWGNWFGNNNSNPMFHFVLADHYIRRNPHLAAPDPRVHVSVTPGASAVFPISRTLARFNSPDSANHFTSACSCIVYRDELFGPHFSNSSFVSEPVHNLVHREVIAAQGVTFTSRRAPDEQTSEFLASSDNWFRPTSLGTGPDGAVWVADMYRAVIEHPQWIPLDWQKRLDLRAGHDRGRIYRIYPAGVKPRAIPRLDRLNTAGLVAALDSPNGWQRDMAQQMLLWRADMAAIPLLEKQARENKRPLCRLHALCTLDGLDALSPELLKQALKDEHPGVRRHAVRLCEGRFAKDPALGEALAKLTSDADAQVRLQLACTLGEWDDPRAGAALGELALKDAGDRFIAAAVLTSVNQKNLEVVLKAVMTAGKEPPPAGLMDALLRMANALNHKKALATLLTAVGTASDGKFTAWHFSALAGLLDGLDQRKISLAKLRDEGDAELKQAVENLKPVFKSARLALTSEKNSDEVKRLAMPLMGRGLELQKEEIILLGIYLQPQTAEELQAAAVLGFGRLSEPSVAGELLRGWKSYSPTMRGRVLDVLLRRDDWLKTTLDALERKDILAADIDASRRQRLLEHRDNAIRTRVTKLFEGLVNPDRQKVIDSYQSVLTTTGDTTKGQAVFTKNCATCHKLGTLGNVVGPDLASIGDKSVQGLLIAVLDPNRAVEARYVNYSAVTKAGLTITGILAQETGNSITLLGQDGKAQTILRKDLDELTSTGKSLMPEGLEKEIKPQDMADLFAFIRATTPQPKPKEFKGNRPETVAAAPDGSLLLTAKNAEIYGKTLVFEPQHENLGYWSSDDDHAIWTVEVPKTGVYTVMLDWACPNQSAGKTFALQAGAGLLSGKVAGTGGWENYKQEKIGTIVLTAGRQRVTFKPAVKLYSSAMLDLRSIKLVPAKE
jgi:putative membrane-bound dehydrogenase-like protein